MDGSTVDPGRTSCATAGRPAPYDAWVPGPALAHVLAGTQRVDDPPGRLHLVVQGSRWFDNPWAPRVRLNGYPVPVGYGDNAVGVPAGRLEVDVHCRLLRRYGDARLDVEVPAGGTVTLFYAPPHHELGTGRLGHEPQRRAGTRTALALALLAVLVAVALAWLLT